MAGRTALVTRSAWITCAGFLCDMTRPLCGVQSNLCPEAEHRQGNSRQLAPPAAGAWEGIADGICSVDESDARVVSWQRRNFSPTFLCFF